MSIIGVKSIESSEIRKIRVNLDSWHTRGHDFCELIVDDSNGRFTAILYGGESYTYSFASKGKKFIEFLIEAFSNDYGYLYGKIHNRECTKMCDLEETIKNMKKRLLKERREKEIDSEEAREIYERIHDTFGSEEETSWDYFYSCYFDGVIDDYFGPEPFHDDFLVSTHDYRCLIFCKEIAPILAEVLKEEYQLTI